MVMQNYAILHNISQKEGKMSHQSLELKLEALVNRIAAVRVIANVELNQDQLEALQILRAHCLNQALDDAEVRRDPRKLRYKTAQELKYSLVAICLAQALTNPQRRHIENKEYFVDNIQVTTADRDWDRIEFGKISPYNVQEAVYPEIINDWMIYRDSNGMGIKNLIDAKTNLVGLPDFNRGGDPIYEFARFHRKYTEKEHRQQEQSRLAAQDAFRNAMVQQVAIEMTKQQMLTGGNPMDLLNQLFAPNGTYAPKLQPQNQIDRQVEQSITRYLEYSNDGNSRER